MKQKLLIKVVVGVLCFVFIMGTPVNMMATEYRQDDTVSVITQEAFQDLFADSTRSVDNLSVETVKYNYNFKAKEKNVAEVEMVAIFSISGKDYPVTLNGVVNGQELDNKEVFWEGPIEGIITINNVDYLVIASFAKLGNSDNNVQICTAIQSMENDQSTLPVVIQFGENIITQQIYNQICHRLTVQKDEKIILSEAKTNRALNYLGIGDDTTEFAYNDKESQYLNVIDVGANRVAAQVLASPDNINEYYRTLGQGAVTGVHSVTTTLSVGNNTSSSAAYIAGTESYSFGNNYNKANVLLKNLFYDVLGMFGFPTEVLDELLEDVRGKVVENFHTNETSVTISGLNDGSIFEEYGLPITFQLDTSLFESTYVGPSHFEMTSSIKYISMYLPLFSDMYTITYTNTEEAYVDVPYTIR